MYWREYSEKRINVRSENIIRSRKFCIIQSENKERLLQEVKLFTEQLKEEKKNVANWVLDIDPINAS